MNTISYFRSLIVLAAAAIIPFFVPALAHAQVVETLTVNVTVTNDNGGTLLPADIPIFIDAVAVTMGVSNVVTSGTHVVTATAQTGYATTIEGDCDAGGNVTVPFGESKTCSVILNDIAPQLTVIKTVITDDGGVLLSGSFLMQVTGTNVSTAQFAGNAAGTTVTLNAGAYSVDEGENIFGGETPHGYTKSIAEGCSGSIGLGETRTCTITNDDPDVVPTMGTIRISKTVINDNGGTNVPQDFVFIVHDSDSETPDQSVWIVEVNIDAQIRPGTYTVNESVFLRGEGVPNPYTATYSEGCAGSIIAGQIVTCTITNNDPGSPTPPVSEGAGNLTGGNSVQGTQSLPLPEVNTGSDLETGDAPVTAVPRVLGEEDVADSIGVCRAQEPESVLLTGGLEGILNALNVQRDERIERMGDLLVNKIVPSDTNQQARQMIKNFTDYGTFGNQHLGAGERAGVIDSYRNVYHRLPVTECDWQDALRIARGMMPLTISAEREAEVIPTFKKIYNREPDRTIAAENKTILIMAYGLRPTERSLPAERQAIRRYRSVFLHAPRNADEWDTVRAIAYGGL